MFTGLIEETGRVTALDMHSRQNTSDPANQGGCILTIGTPERTVLQGVQLGDSIAVNGVCLTVISFNNSASQAESKEAGSADWWFTVGVAPETLARTCLGQLKLGDKVNLERSLAANGRMGGHFVQGHVDGTATIAARTVDGDSLRLVFEASQSLMKFIVEKGYVAIDGISLTVCAPVTERSFAVMLIAYTQTKVNLPDKAVGALVNIEVDILGKYVDKFVGSRAAPALSAPSQSSPAAGCPAHTSDHSQCHCHGWGWGWAGRDHCQCSAHGRCCRMRWQRPAIRWAAAAAVFALGWWLGHKHHHHCDAAGGHWHATIATNPK